MTLSAYCKLERRFERLGVLTGIDAALSWDAAVNLPPGGLAARSEQRSLLALLNREVLADPRVGALLDEAEAAKAVLDPWRQANLREMRRLWRHAICVEESLCGALAEATSNCEMAWRQARADNDFEGFKPQLRHVFDLKREEGAAKAEMFGGGAYGALLEAYEPAADLAAVDMTFEYLAKEIPRLLQNIVGQECGGPADAPPPMVPVERQQAIVARLTTMLGFDNARGRVDLSTHPMTVPSMSGDVRLTTRFRPDDFIEGIIATIHELGHALYEQGLPAHWHNQPVGMNRGASIHESQSLLFEMQACRSTEFIQAIAPVLADTYGLENAADLITRRYRRVGAGPIRVEADEVSYPLHIIHRYKIERGIIENKVSIDDIPEYWAALSEELLEIGPTDHRNGCLQDIHWSIGLIGYFPTYLLGAMTAAQLFDAATRQDNAILPSIGQLNFEPLRRWVRSNIHEWGCRFGAAELVARATGKLLDPQIYLQHLRQRYQS